MPTTTPAPKGMSHEFWLLRQNEWTYAQGRDVLFLHHHPTRLLMEDDIVQYVYDTLKWVPTINPAMIPPQRGYGLNLYGPTLIQADGACILTALLNGWMLIFAQGPATFGLTGHWSHDLDDDENQYNGHYETITVEKERLLAALQQLDRYAKKTCEEAHVIAHFGL